MEKSQIVIEQQQIESLDLLDFFKVLGRGLWLILLCTALFGGIAFGATYLIKQEWKAEAYIDPPTTVEIGNYYALFSTYKLVSGNAIDTSVQDKKALLDNDAQIIEGAYQEMKRQLTSYDTRRQFWLNTDYYKQQLTDDSKKDTDLLETLIVNTRFAEGNQAKKLPARITLQLDNPKQATELLTAFMEVANVAAREALYRDLIVKWQTLFNQTNSAVQANLGKIKQGPYIDEQDWPGKLKVMQSVKPLDNNFTGYRSIKAPILLAKTYPVRMLWTSIAAVFGVLFGCALVLSLNLRKSRKRSQHP